MYLAMLSGEEKELFLGLAYALASSDGNYSDEEKAMMNGYCQEMQITFVKEEMVKPTEYLLKRFNEISNHKTKKIIVFEAIGLAMADGSYDDSERELIARIEENFQLETGFAEKCESILSEYILFQAKINQLII